MTSVTTPVAERNAPRSAKPVHGTIKLVRPCNAYGQGGCVKINTQVYSLQLLHTGFRLLRLAEDGKVLVYELPADLRGCTCPDSVQRRRLCKHALGLAALRGANKIT
jgi:hypothetical protein